MASKSDGARLLVSELKSLEDDADYDVVKDWSDAEPDESAKDIDERKHAQLLNALRVLDGKRVPLAQTGEYAAKVSEHHKRAASSSTSLAEVGGVMSGGLANYGETKKKLRTMQERNRVVNEPLPKPESERLLRSVAYEKTTKDVAKWEPVIEENRLAEHLQFPLHRPNIRAPSADGFVQRFKPRTPLELEVAALLGSSDHVLEKRATLTKAEERALRAMDVEEARRRRAEMQKHRALLSFKEAKARRQNKIKSKRYHRILRKEKQKQEEKTLQALAAVDPEAYAQRMDKLDKMRIEERLSLKHRGGSRFAKLKARYGKHDDISRQAISDMYDQSHRLTQKTQLPESQGDEDEKQEPSVPVTAGGASWSAVSSSIGSLSSSGNPQRVLPTDARNPWLASGESNTARGTSRRVKFDLSTSVRSVSTSEFSIVNQSTTEGGIPTAGGTDGDGGDGASSSSSSARNQPADGRTGGISASGSSQSGSFINGRETDAGTVLGCTKQAKPATSQAEADPAGSKRKRRKHKAKGQGQSNEDDNVSAGKQQRRMSDEQVEKTSVIKSNLEKAEEDISDDEMITETLERRQTLSDIDSALASEPVAVVRKLKHHETAALQAAVNVADDNTVSVDNRPGAAGKQQKTQGASRQVNVAHSTLPDTVVSGDGGDMTEQKLNIIEAFADDDVIEEFSEEKRALEERDKPKDVDLTLPGWGEWAGAGVLPDSAASRQRRRKARRFMVKAPPAPPRQDRNLSKVIISEAKNSNLSKHQVSEIPYPFTSIQQYESSIRMPIGRTWNAEAAFRSMIVPRVTTRMGAIIEPIDSSELFKKQKSKQKQPGGYDSAKDVAAVRQTPGKPPGSIPGRTQAVARRRPAPKVGKKSPKITSDRSLVSAKPGEATKKKIKPT